MITKIGWINKVCNMSIQTTTDTSDEGTNDESHHFVVYNVNPH